MTVSKKAFTLILFGATGDLAIQKLFPALSALHENGELEKCAKILAVSRREWQTADFVSFLTAESEKNYSESFKKRIEYAKVDVDYDTEKGYAALEGMIEGEPIVYLSLAPKNNAKAIQDLRKAKILRKGRGKLLIEKPFGTDEESAKALNKLVKSFLKETQIFRIDHYLGRATVRATMRLHRLTPGLEALMDKDHVDSIRVRFFESSGVNGRGASYDGVGAFRDIGQNHVLEMLAVLAASGKHRQPRTKILESLAPASKTCGLLRRGQYSGYTKEDKVRPDSDTETAFEAMMSPSHGDLEGVMVTLEGGKYMPKSEVYTEVVFKDFADLPHSMIFSIKPKEEIVVVERDGSRDTFDVFDGRDPYENILADALAGRMDFFVGGEEVEALWRYADQVLACFAQIHLQEYDNQHPF